MLRPRARRLRLRGLLTLWLCLVSSVASAQAPTIQYAYDELGRLVAVVDQDSNAAIYVYDAVGNLLSIQRVDATTVPGPVAITAVVPEKGKPGTVVSILGKGFAANAGLNAVAFNGASAVTTSAAPNRIITVVPFGATTGPITVSAPLGSAVSPRPFRVVGVLVIAPTTVTLGIAGTQQFVASDGGVETTHVIWAVDGIVGGDPSVGTVSPQGLYVAPTTIGSLSSATVTATSKDDVAVVASAVVTFRPPLPLFLAATSVGVNVTDPGLRSLVALSVGVQLAPEITGLTIVAAAIGVTPTGPDAFSSALVSVSVEPLVTSITPVAAAHPSTNLSVTMTGSGLADVISLEFLRNNAPDTTITVANVTATAEGTQTTAQISISAFAIPGPRVIRIRTPLGTTTSVGTGGNVFTVQ